MANKDIAARAVTVAALFTLVGSADIVSAQSDGALENPPVIGRPAPDPDSQMIPQPLDLSVALAIGYRDGSLWNPSTDRRDRVRLRSYFSDETEITRADSDLTESFGIPRLGNL